MTKENWKRSGKETLTDQLKSQQQQRAHQVQMVNLRKTQHQEIVKREKVLKQTKAQTKVLTQLGPAKVLVQTG